MNSKANKYKNTNTSTDSYKTPQTKPHLLLWTPMNQPTNNIKYRSIYEPLHVSIIFGQDNQKS